MKRFVFSSCIFVVFLFSSCFKENIQLDKIAQIEYNPNLAIPLAHVSLSINDVVEKLGGDSLIQVDNENLIHFIYEDDIISFNENFVFLPNQNYGFNYDLSATEATALSSLPSGNTLNINSLDSIDFNLSESVIIDSTLLKKGNLLLTFNSDIRHDIEITVTLPKVKKDGVAFSQKVNLDYVNTVPVSTTSTFDLTGYSLDFTGGGTNKLAVEYGFKFTATGNMASASEGISASVEFKDLEFRRIVGYFGQVTFNVAKDTTNIDVFDFLSKIGSVTFADPQFTIDITNSYGIPLQANFSTLDAIINSLPTAITGLPSPLAINNPTLSQIGQSVTSSFSLNRTNSNIATVLSSSPNKIVYEVSGSINPDGPTSNRNFMLDTSKMEAHVKADVPLNIRVGGLEIKDTIDFSLNESIDQIQTLLLRASIDNSLPFDVAIQAYFTDSLYNVKDSLLNNPTELLMQSGIVDVTTGKVISSTKKVTDFNFTEEKLTKLNNVKKIIVKSKVVSSTNGTIDVKIYTDYKMDIRLGVQTQLKAKF